MVYLLLLSISGLVFYIYTICCFRKKIVLYTIENNLIILKDTHFKLQKRLGLFNLIIFTLAGLLALFINENFTNRNFIIIYLFFMSNFYWISNYIMKYISIRKGYSIKKINT